MLDKYGATRRHERPAPAGLSSPSPTFTHALVAARVSTLRTWISAFAAQIGAVASTRAASSESTPLACESEHTRLVPGDRQSVRSDGTGTAARAVDLPVVVSIATSEYPPASATRAPRRPAVLSKWRHS